jgi:hypothetical protein
MHRITVSAEEFNLDGTSYDVPRYLLRFPGLGNQSADVNGELYVTMEDNATKDVTPSLQHVNLTNYSFNVSAERYLIHLNFRNSGYLTGPEANGDGYDAANYTHLIQYCATNLGVHATIDDGTAAQRGSNWMNLEEIFATVPVSVNLSWEWHQDKQRARYLWRPGDTIVTQTDPLVNFSTQGPGGGNDMPAGNLADSTPDAQGNVYIPDSPSLPLTEPALVNAPVGSVAALRFYGHTWLTANGGFASEILKWRTFITIKKTANGWIRAGANNFISLTPMGVSEDPSFTVQDAIDATGP